MMMTIKLYTDKELREFCDMRKRVTNPGARWLEKPTRKPVHRQRSFKASSEQDENLVAGEGEPVHRFEIYQRQNLRDDKDFSCGIAYLPHGGSRLTLARYTSATKILENQVRSALRPNQARADRRRSVRSGLELVFEDVGKLAG